MSNLTRKYAHICNNPGKTDIVQPYTWLGLMATTDQKDRYFLYHKMNVGSPSKSFYQCFIDIIHTFLAIDAEDGSNVNFPTAKLNFAIGQKMKDTKETPVPGCKGMVLIIIEIQFYDQNVVFDIIGDSLCFWFINKIH